MEFIREVVGPIGAILVLMVALVYVGMQVGCVVPTPPPEIEPAIQYEVSCKRPGGEVIYEGPVVSRPRADSTLRLFVFATPEGHEYAVPVEYCISNTIPEMEEVLLFQEYKLVGEN